MVAFTGSGGKTTCAESLANATAAAGWRVALSTTTKMRIPEQLHDIRDVAAAEALLGNANTHTASPYLLGTVDGQKIVGPPLPLLEDIADRPWLDLLVLEADGSRGASLKGYRDGEPVLPRRVDRCVVLLGIDVLGAAPDSPLVHRPERLAPYLRGQPVDISNLRRAIFSQPGYLDRCAFAPISLLLNKVDDARARDDAEKLVEAWERPLLASPIEQVLARGTAIQGGIQRVWNRPRRHVAGVVLAAGRSSRFGALKQLHEIDGKPLVRHVVDQMLASSVDALLVVVGHEGERVRQALEPLSDRLRFLHNADFASGMSTSIALAAQACSNFEGMLLALGDMPWLTAEHVNRVLEAAAATPCGIVVPTRDGRRGHPVYFARRYYASLASLGGDRGANSLLHTYPFDLQTVAMADDAVLRDVDVPSDLPV